MWNTRVEKLSGGRIGYVGIIGPTRMNYSRLAARLEYFASGLGALIQDVITDGGDDESYETTEGMEQ